MTTPSSAERSPDLLFRREAIEFARVRQYGNVVLAQPVSHRFLVLFFTAIVAAVMLFLATFSTTRATQGQGLLVPTSGVIRVVTAQAGIVLASHAHEGRVVHAGDVLFELSGERPDARLGSTERTVFKLLRERHDSFVDELARLRLQYRQRREDADRHHADLASELKDIGDQISLQEQRVQLGEQTLRRNDELQATGYISAAQLQDKQAELLDQRQRLGELRRTSFLKKQDLGTNESATHDLPAQEEREVAALARNISLTEQDMAENEAKRRIEVVAPQDGMLTAVTAEPGQAAVAGATLVSVIDKDAQLEAEIYLASRAVGFVHPGMDVLLRYQAYPYQKFGQFGARVTEVAATSLRPEDLASVGAPPQLATGAEPVYRVRLRLDNQTIPIHGARVPLKSGMLLDASIVLERRHLYEWIIDPLVSLTK